MSQLEASDSQRKIEASAKNWFAFTVSYYDRIASGKNGWMRFDLGYAHYDVSLEESDDRGFLASRDSASISVGLAYIQIAPEFEVGKNTRIYIPVRFDWPISSTETGKTVNYNPPGVSVYNKAPSDYGKFNLNLGVGLSYRMMVGPTYGVMLGPVICWGLLDQTASPNSLQVMNYVLSLSLYRRVVLTKPLID